MIFSFAPLLAALPDLPTADRSTKTVSFIFSDLVLILGIIVVISGALLYWAAIIRGPKQQGSARRIYKEVDGEGSSDGSGKRRRKKRKVRRREHRARNPTLAEAGGLPQPRSPEVPPQA